MINVQITSKKITEKEASELIMKSCKANRIRTQRGDVSFSVLANGNYQALLRDEDGYVIAMAEVEKTDN